jgi:hypothetical protein
VANELLARLDGADLSTWTNDDYLRLARLMIETVMGAHDISAEETATLISRADHERLITQETHVFSGPRRSSIVRIASHSLRFLRWAMTGSFPSAASAWSCV